MRSWLVLLGNNLNLSYQNFRRQVLKRSLPVLKKKDTKREYFMSVKGCWEQSRDLLDDQVMENRSADTPV